MEAVMAKDTNPHKLIWQWIRASWVAGIFWPKEPTHIQLLTLPPKRNNLYVYLESLVICKNGTSRKKR